MYINKYIYINICMYRIQRYTVLPYIKHPDMPLSIPGMAMAGRGDFLTISPLKTIGTLRKFAYLCTFIFSSTNH